MKVLYFIVGIWCVQQISAQDTSALTAACISTQQLLAATAMACQQKNNTDLWQKIIDCHEPISDQFLRVSSEARCPKNRHVEDPMDTSFSIQEVFFNICDLIEGSPEDRSEGLSCLISGTMSPYRMSHAFEVNIVHLLFGENVPCDLGICIKKLFNFS
ncbi:uncharacterized protein LOC119086053 [Bradysia coprophila]|uniref:uncharacterized protein LOC119086053 n=1 Tax=Bradysia coprophila TaxID=38358 RepID=UPI00187DA7DE|nr:uncharacterized protein LOC119086053 [Bradysia coprophila]